ncbi:MULTISPECIES: hypothetical protein [unclassified Streptomyces]|uniref:hypothetical protein n=1 Tax=unclassified Streptomyces TaxID=2593676 RepID=UPI002E23B90A
MGGSMFAEAMLGRVLRARAALATALEAANADAYAVAVAQDEVDDAVRVAWRHGVGVGPVEA